MSLLSDLRRNPLFLSVADAARLVGISRERRARVEASRKARIQNSIHTRGKGIRTGDKTLLPEIPTPDEIV
jgi:hypothetical protein